METYDFTSKRWDYDTTDSPSRNEVQIAMAQMSAYIQPSFDNTDNYLAGVRTSATVFTPTVSPVWTVDALIGYYVIALDADTSHIVYTVSRVASNIATALTIETDWGDAALVTSADTILVYATLDLLEEDVNYEVKA